VEKKGFKKSLKISKVFILPNFAEHTILVERLTVTEKEYVIKPTSATCQHITTYLHINLYQETMREFALHTINQTIYIQS
jgi:hypothetical protein